MAEVIIPTRGTDRLRAHRWAMDLGYPVHFVCDDERQRGRVMRKTGCQRNRCHVAQTPDGLGQSGIAYVRDWVCQQLVPVGDWIIWIDDNVKRLTSLPHPFCNTDRIDFDFDDEPDIGWRDAFEQTAENPRYVLDQLIEKCIDNGTIFGGFAIETNFFFRRLRYQWWGYARTQCAVYRNDGRSWLAWDGMMLEDFVKSVDVVCRYGKVVIDRFSKPDKPAFEEGGIGSFEDRLPNLRHDCKMLMERYPGLLKPVKPDVDYQLTFAKRSQRTIDAWRRDHGFKACL